MMKVPELRRVRFHDITHPEHRDTHVELIRELMAGRQRARKLEKRYVHKDGHVVWGNVSVSLLAGAQGEPRSFISQIEDVTVARETAGRLRRSVARLQRRSSTPRRGSRYATSIAATSTPTPISPPRSGRPRPM
jgi:hypothetical protein